MGRILLDQRYPGGDREVYTKIVLGKQILQGTLDLGGYQKFSLYVVYVFFPLGQLGFIISLMSQAAASSQRKVSMEPAPAMGLMMSG